MSIYQISFPLCPRNWSNNLDDRNRWKWFVVAHLSLYKTLIKLLGRAQEEREEDVEDLAISALVDPTKLWLSCGMRWSLRSLRWRTILSAAQHFCCSIRLITHCRLWCIAVHPSRRLTDDDRLTIGIGDIHEMSTSSIRDGVAVEVGVREVA